MEGMYLTKVKTHREKTLDTEILGDFFIETTKKESV